MIPVQIEKHLLPEEIKASGIDTIAVDLLSLLQNPGLETLLAHGGLRGWLRFDGDIIAMLGTQELWQGKQVNVDQAGIVFRDQRGNRLTVTPAQWVEWQIHLGLQQVFLFSVPLDLLSRNKQKIAASQQASWLKQQQAVAGQYQLIDPNQLPLHQSVVIDSQAGTVYTEGGCYDINKAEHHDQLKPLVEGCQCVACVHYSRAYLHQMFLHHEAFGVRLLLQHNLVMIAQIG